jgi:hypothetical protein
MLDNRIVDLFRRFLSDENDVGSFCDEFEVLFNLEIDKSLLDSDELEDLSTLFDVVVWYSPFPEERAVIPNYKDEQTIINATKIAANSLGIV